MPAKSTDKEDKKKMSQEEIDQTILKIYESINDNNSCDKKHKAIFTGKLITYFQAATKAKIQKTYNMNPKTFFKSHGKNVIKLIKTYEKDKHGKSKRRNRWYLLDDLPVRPLGPTERPITKKKKSTQTIKDKKPDIKKDEIKSDISSDSELSEADQLEILKDQRDLYYELYHNSQKESTRVFEKSQKFLSEFNQIVNEITEKRETNEFSEKKRQEIRNLAVEFFKQEHQNVNSASEPYDCNGFANLALAFVSTIDTTFNKLLGPVIGKSCSSHDDNDMVQ